MNEEMTHVGRELGRYRILEQVGSGGMSVVYRGLDTALDREVAVKVLHPHLAGKEEARLRMTREAKAVAKLHHSNILEVFDFSNSTTGPAYIVTEFIRGQTLKQFVEAHPFSPPELAAMAIHALATALAHAHEAGIIHRDLKPENVMVREDGVLKLMDFGIAKIIDRDDRMTMTGALVGSPAHMAPEIINGEEASAAADVFSLGTLLYFLITRRLPFTGVNTTATLKAILDGAFEDPQIRAPALSNGLAEIVRRCLARLPQDRYPSAAEVQQALQAYLESFRLTPVDTELKAYFAAPGPYSEQLPQRLTACLVPQARTLVVQKKPAQALACLNQILALEPKNAEALALLRGMNVSKARKRFWRRAALGLGGVVVAALALASFREAPKPVPPASAPAAAVAPAPIPVPPAVQPEHPTTSRPRREFREERKREERKEDSRNAAPATRPPVAVAVAKVPVKVHLRPYGSIRLDGDATPSEELPLFSFETTPGTHQVTVSCTRFCEEAVRPIDVEGTGKNEFFLTPVLRPALLRFEWVPDTAEVSVNGKVITAKASLDSPLSLPSAAARGELRHEEQIEVSAPGYKPLRKTIKAIPGEITVVRGELEQESSPQ